MKLILDRNEINYLLVQYVQKLFDGVCWVGIKYTDGDYTIEILDYEPSDISGYNYIWYTTSVE